MAPKVHFFMKQTIGNACGTIALLHIIGNGGAALKKGELIGEKMPET